MSVRRSVSCGALARWFRFLLLRSLLRIVPLFRAKPSTGNGFLMTSDSAISALQLSALRTRLPSHLSPMAKEIAAATTFGHFSAAGACSNRTDRNASLRAVYTDHDAQRLFHSLQNISRRSKTQADDQSH